MKLEDVKKIAMIGAGDMGHGIAACCLQGGYTVVLRDIDQKFVDKGMAGIKNSFGKFLEKGKMTKEAHDDALARLIPMVDLQEAVKDADFIIEGGTGETGTQKERLRRSRQVLLPNTPFWHQTPRISASRTSPPRRADRTR